MTSWNRSRFWSQWIELHGFLHCELASYKHGCASGFECHHIISRHLLKGNKRALKHVHKYWYIFLASLCPAHNEIADDWETRYILLDMRVQLLGAEVVAVAITKLLSLLKAPMPELNRYLEHKP